MGHRSHGVQSARAGAPAGGRGLAEPGSLIKRRHVIRTWSPAQETRSGGNHHCAGNPGARCGGLAHWEAVVSGPLLPGHRGQGCARGSGDGGKAPASPSRGCPRCASLWRRSRPGHPFGRGDRRVCQEVLRGLHGPGASMVLEETPDAESQNQNPRNH